MLEKSLFKRLFINSHTGHSNEYVEELQSEIITLNIYRDRLLATALVILSVIASIFQLINIRKSDYYVTAYIRFFCIYVVMIIAALMFLIFTRKNKGALGNQNFLTLAHILLNEIVLIFCSIISVEGMLMNQLPLTYVIAAFSIATLELLETKERDIIYLLPYIIYFFGILFFQKDIIIVFKDILYFTSITALAVVISEMNYSSYVKNFINNKIIVKQNQELQELQKSTEEALTRRTEELNKTVEYEKLRTAFFANISHELRTPLNLIYSAVQMVELITRSNPVPEKQKEMRQYMNIMKQNCYRLIRLIANLIDTTKIDAGYFNVSLKNCDIVKVVEDITLSSARYIENKSIDLIFDTEIEEQLIACDPDKIERIMLNLLSNAVKFTPKGGKIEVNIYDRDNEVIISVKDTGVGVPDEMKELIFERFIQVDGSTSRSVEGSGLGLSIVKSLIEMHNGKIILNNQAEKGSEFVITLPKVTIEEQQQEHESNLIDADNRIEKVNVEFSDIYT